MTKMPEPKNPYAGYYHEGEFQRSTWAEAFDEGAKAQRELLKGWIPLPSDERMADITAKAGGLPSPEWKTILKMLQEGDEQAKA